MLAIFSFAEVAVNAPTPYVRPTLTPKGMVFAFRRSVLICLSI